MAVRVVTFGGRALGRGPGRAIRAWFKPMKTSTPLMTQTWRGTMGTQDVYSCDVS
jgi:hypothetical protein